MDCITCGSKLPSRASACPVCGTPASYSTSDNEGSAYNVPLIPHTNPQPADTNTQPQSTKSAANYASQTRRPLEAPQGSTSYHIPIQGIRASRTSGIEGTKGCIIFAVVFTVLMGACSGLFLYIGHLNQQSSSDTSTLISQLRITTPTAPTIGNPYPPYNGTLAINDPLSDNSGGYGWMDEATNPSPETKGCHFVNAAYHVSLSTMPSPYMGYCLALNTNFSDFVYQVNMTILEGNVGGVVFRQATGYKYYYFSISTDGGYSLSVNTGDHSQLLKNGSNTAIHMGQNQTNVLGVVANGSAIDLYVNQQHITTAFDTTYSAGRIGAAAESIDGSVADVAFSNVMVWAL